MSDHLLEALKNYQGKTICYTGGKLSGKTTYASLMALAVYDDGGEGVKVATIDLDIHKSIAQESLDLNCMELGIPTIQPSEQNLVKLSEELNKYQVIVIDLPLKQEMPIELLPTRSAQREKVLSSDELKDNYCKEWYQSFLKSISTALFILPGNDIEDHTHEAMEFLAKYNLSTSTTGLKYFDALGANDAPYTRYIDEIFEEIGITLSKGAEPLMQCDDYVSIINTGDMEYSDLLFRPEYLNHYESIHGSDT
jgi:hypothetical protein